MSKTTHRLSGRDSVFLQMTIASQQGSRRSLLQNKTHPRSVCSAQKKQLMTIKECSDVKYWEMRGNLCMIPKAARTHSYTHTHIDTQKPPLLVLTHIHPASTEGKRAASSLKSCIDSLSRVKEGRKQCRADKLQHSKVAPDSKREGNMALVLSTLHRHFECCVGWGCFC